MPLSTRPRKKYLPKSRQHDTHVQFTALADENGQLRLDIDDAGRISSPQALEGTFRLLTAYERESGKRKVVFSHGTEHPGSFLTEKQQLQSSFDCLACIDTNTEQVGDLKVSVSCLAISVGSLSEPDDEVTFDVLVYVFFDVPSDVNPEMVGLDIAFHHFLSATSKELSRKWGVITDCELGKHDKINNREIPYLGQKFLGENFRLIYASSDTGSGVSNKLIRVCDAQSKKVLSHCKANPQQLQPKDDSYKFCRGWMLAHSEGGQAKRIVG